MTGIRVRCLDYRGETEHLGTVLGVTQDGHDTLVVVLCDDGEARVVHYRRIRADQTQPQAQNTGLGAIIGQWPGDETEEQIADALERLS